MARLRRSDLPNLPTALAFESRMRKLVGVTQEKMALVMRKTEIDMATRIILKTPVDTGRARANWQPSWGAPAGGTLTTVDPNGAETVSNVATAVAAGDPLASSFFLTNNLPYIIPLEFGWSQQAPNGMVATTIQEFKSIVESNAAEVRATTIAKLGNAA